MGKRALLSEMPGDRFRRELIEALSAGLGPDDEHFTRSRDGGAVSAVLRLAYEVERTINERETAYAVTLQLTQRIDQLDMKLTEKQKPAL